MSVQIDGMLSPGLPAHSESQNLVLCWSALISTPVLESRLHVPQSVLKSHYFLFEVTLLYNTMCSELQLRISSNRCYHITSITRVPIILHQSMKPLLLCSPLPPPHLVVSLGQSDSQGLFSAWFYLCFSMFHT